MLRSLVQKAFTSPLPAQFGSVTTSQRSLFTETQKSLATASLCKSVAVRNLLAKQPTNATTNMYCVGRAPARMMSTAAIEEKKTGDNVEVIEVEPPRTFESCKSI